MALLSLGFSIGVAYTVACGDKNPGDAHADEGDSGETSSDTDTDTDTAPPPGGFVAGRAVVEVLYYNTDETFRNGTDAISCAPTGPFASNDYYDGSNHYTVDTAALEAACCPSGFSFVGWGGGSGFAAVYLEDI